MNKDVEHICVMCPVKDTYPKCSQCNAKAKLVHMVDNKFKSIKKRMMKSYADSLDMIYAEEDKEYTSIGKRLIEKIDRLGFILDYDICIAYVRSNEQKQSKGKPVLGDCKKVSNSMKAFLPFDYVITLYEYNIDTLSENQIKLLIYHELRHIKLGDRGLTIRYHDIEEFSDILLKYGYDWEEREDIEDITEVM